MNRREFASLAGAALAWPLAAVEAQQTARVIGYFSTRSAESEAPVREPFLAALRQTGFVAGQNLVVEYRFADGRRDRLPALAADLLERGVTLLVTTDPSAALAAKEVSTTVPIVFTSGQDPIRLGLVQSLSRPGGSATGVNPLTTELGPKRLGILRELMPAPGLIAFIADPQGLNAAFYVDEMKAAAEAVKQPLLVLYTASPEDIDDAFAAIVQSRAAAVLYSASTFFQVVTDKLVALAARHRVPALYEWREFVTAGGLASYSTNRTEVGRLLGNYAARILNGAKPADLPVVQSSKFELVINLKTAKALGLTVPQSLLASADEVIE